jgi:GAF domain-containing protein
VVADRLVDIFTLMERHGRSQPGRVALCSVAARFLQVSGAGIALTSGGDELTSLCTSNGVARRLMDLETTVGEGPASEASRSGLANDEADLAGPRPSRWSIYAPQALDHGARAVAGFPVRIGAVHFGALALFRDRPGYLSATQSSDAYLMASVIGRAVLAMQAGATEEGLAGDFVGQSTFDFSVHQAAGMVAVQGSMSVKGALVMLRAHAFALGVDLSALASAVVAGRDWFDGVAGLWRDESDG